jgi:hypothetical protein
MRISVHNLRKLIREVMSSDPDIVRPGDTMIRSNDNKIFRVTDYTDDEVYLISSDGDADRVQPGKGLEDWIGDEGEYQHRPIHSIPDDLDLSVPKLGRREAATVAPPKKRKLSKMA